MFKVDLHTHSTASPDGGISELQYQKALDDQLLDYIAITDHNRVDFAVRMNKHFGSHIIVGEEVMTAAGEIIGLYLKERIQPGLSPLETVKQIKDQGGLVYIPHPFETIRKGLPPHIVEEIVEHVDIMEIYNGRAFAQNRSPQVVVFAKLNQLTGAASSDAHGFKGLGNTFTRIAQEPNASNLVSLLGKGSPIVGRPTVRSLMYPKYHKLRKRLARDS